MKHTNLALLAAAAIALQSCNTPSPTTSDGLSHQHYITIRPLPDKLDFAGEQVPLDRNYIREAIEREVLTTSCMHTSTTLTIRRASRYFPVIEPILKEYGVPNDFKYLAMAESGLNENAQSHARASGFWQFLESAGKEYGLEVNDDVDERYHLEKSTRAACEYLLKSYEKFGSWSLAAASYNAGSNGVDRRMEVQSIDNYWDLFLPEETMRYVPRILSFKILMSDPQSYGFNIGRAEALKPFKRYKTIVVDDRKIEWSKIAIAHGTTYRELRILNPWIRSYEHKNGSRKSYEVKMPKSNFSKN